MLRVAMRAPEVVVKVTGSNHSRAGVRAHLAYLGREKDAAAELSDGQRLMGRAAIAGAADLFDEDPAFVMTNRSSNGVRAVHVVFSMPSGSVEGPELLAAVRETARRSFGSHEYLLVLHTDKDHKHVHAVVSSRDLQGRKLRHYKSQLREWRREFALQLRKRGIRAEATSRPVRGVTQRSVSKVIYSLRARAGRGGSAGRVVHVLTDLEKVREVARESDATARANARGSRPWEARVRARRAQVASGWQDLSRHLRGLGTSEGLRAAAIVDRFRDELPRVWFERDEIRSRLQRAFGIGNSKQQQR
jgi:hypothetical protein